MKHKVTTLTLALFAISSSFQFAYADKLPSEVKVLTKRRADAISKIEKIYSKNLEALKIKYTKQGNLDAANAIAELIDSQDGEPVVADPELDGTIWTFSNKAGKLATFEFLPGGKIKSDKYDDPRWKRLNSESILFQYGKDGSWVVFNFADRRRRSMNGFNSELGTPRYLRRVK